MTLFQELAARNLPCELCGSPTVALYGGGWDNDRIYCTNKDCGAEYEFPTTTVIDESEVSE